MFWVNVELVQKYKGKKNGYHTYWLKLTRYDVQFVVRCILHNFIMYKFLEKIEFVLNQLSLLDTPEGGEKATHKDNI